jgi:hypothetical protein
LLSPTVVPLPVLIHSYAERSKVVQPKMHSTSNGSLEWRDLNRTRFWNGGKVGKE